MASNFYYFHLILFLIPLCNFCLKSYSQDVDRASDYDKWLSWNVQNHHRKTLVQAESITQAPGGGGRALDGKLSKAETNKVKISVCQNGTGDFRTIKEAINSIPLNNTRRVILQIKPGVYR